ncbi:MAG: hypothetical protein U0Y08_14925 [Bacteroidia bacterium]
METLEADINEILNRPILNILTMNRKADADLLAASINDLLLRFQKAGFPYEEIKELHICFIKVDGMENERKKGVIVQDYLMPYRDKAKQEARRLLKFK